jgi:hypothetical protein
LITAQQTAPAINGDNHGENTCERAKQQDDDEGEVHYVLRWTTLYMAGTFCQPQQWFERIHEATSPCPAELPVCPPATLAGNEKGGDYIAAVSHAVSSDIQSPSCRYSLIFRRSWRFLSDFLE